jgi:nucleotide-binding universal stress UspA family protein
MHVVLGVDGSAGSHAACRFVSQILGPQDEVTLYHAPPQIAWPASIEPQVAERARQALAQSIFEAAKNELPQKLREVHTILGTQRAAPGLLAAADAARADLIAVGHRGASHLQTWLLGGVSNAVVHTSKLPVLVVRSPSEQQAHRGKPLTVVLGYDGSDLAQQAGEALGGWTFPPGSVGRVASVVDGPIAGSVPEWILTEAKTSAADLAKAWQESHAQRERERTAEIAALIPRLPPIFASKSPLLLRGEPAEQILSTAASLAADLIVVGAHGASSWQRAILGSTSDKVLSHAECSVLVVHTRARP